MHVFENKDSRHIKFIEKNRSSPVAVFNTSYLIFLSTPTFFMREYKIIVSNNNFTKC